MSRRRVILARDDRGYLRLIPADVAKIESIVERPAQKRLTTEEKILCFVAVALIVLAVILGLVMAH